jgi:hypothetical protein
VVTEPARYVERPHAELSHIAERHRLDRVGGTWLDRPWYLSERNLIWEIERPDDRRHWDFFVRVEGKDVSLVLVSMDGRKMLACAGEPFALLKLAEWQGPIPA